MKHSFGLSGGTAGIENVEWVFCIHRLWGTESVALLHFLVPPDITTWFKLNLVIRSPENDHSMNLIVILQRVVDALLERNDSSSSITAVGCDHNRSIAVLDSIFNRLRTKPSEHDRVN